MRKLVWFTLGLGAACAFCANVWMLERLILPGILFGMLFLLGMLGGRRIGILKPIAVCCLGICAGLLWVQVFHAVYLSVLTPVDGAMADVTARCTDYSYETEYGSAVEGFLYLEGKPYRTKFYVNSTVDMEPGDVLKGRFQLRITTGDGEKGPTFHQGKGILILAYQKEDLQLLKLTDTPFWAYPAIIRRHFSDTINTAFPEDAAPFARALLLGDRSGIDYETNTSFQISGIAHIIAVSGLHVSILFTLINILCLKRRWLVAIIGLPALFLFAVVAGFSPSVVRACVMQGLMILASLAGRDYDGPTELSFATLVMLVANPLVVTSVSFLLSVGCVSGILLLQNRIYSWLYEKICNRQNPGFVKMKRWFASSVSVTCASMALTTPFSAASFGSVSLVGVLTNLLTLWVIGFIFYGIILVCLLSALLPGMAAVAAAVVSWPIRYVLWISGLFAAFPLSAVYTRSIYITAWLVFSYVLLAVFLIGRKKQPALLVGCMVFGLCISLAASWLEPFTDACRLTVLDVGQGQSILYQSEGKTFLVDCGGDYDEDAADLAAETLLSQGISRVDGVVVTHFDRDHAGGVGYFLSRIPADMILIPDYWDELGIRQKLEDRYGDRIYPVEEDILLTYADTGISVFAPVMNDSGNESSLAVLFEHENCDILITGDRSGFGERMLLKTAQLPRVDVLVAGHHGAANSTCQELLDAVRPEIVVISVGENSYGHPADALLNRLRDYGCIVYRTDIHGNIVLRR